MEAVNSNTDIQNKSSTTPSPPRNLLILEKIRQANAQRLAKANNNQLKQTSEEASNEQAVHRTFLKVQKESCPSSNSFENKIELINRTTLQEKLFASQCKQFKQKNSEKLSVSNSPAARNSESKSRNRRRNKTYSQEKNNFEGIKTCSSENTINFKQNKSCRSENNNVKQNKSCRSGNNNNQRNKSCHSENNNDLERNKSCNSENTINVERAPSPTALHLKHGIVNKQNEAVYHKYRGRMEPMNWSAINGEKEHFYSTKDSYRAQTSKQESHDKIEKLARMKYEANAEFLNFVKNSTTSKNVYQVGSNFTQIQNIDSSLSKVKRKIKNSAAGKTLQITQEIKQKFKPLQTESSIHLNDLIDSPINNLSTLQDEKAKLYKTSEDKENSKVPIVSQTVDNKIKKSQVLSKVESQGTLSTSSRTNGPEKKIIDEEYVKKSQDLNKVESTGTLSTSTKENLLLTNGAKKKIVDEYVKKSQDLKKVESKSTLSTSTKETLLLTNGAKKKIIDKYVKKSQDLKKVESKSTLSTSTKETLLLTNEVKKKIVNEEYDDEMFKFVKPTPNTIPPTKMSNSNSGSSEFSKNTDSTKFVSTSCFQEIQKLHKSSLNTSLDSDDFSLEQGSELDDLSALRGSTFSKYEAVRNKIKNVSVEHSLILNQNVNVEQKHNIEDKADSDKLLMKQTVEHNNIEAKEIEIIPKEEAVLKAVSTQYLQKSSENEVKLTKKKVSKIDIIKRAYRKLEERNKTNSNLTVSLQSKHDDSAEVDQDSGVGLKTSNSSDDSPTSIETNSSENCIIDLNQKTKDAIEIDDDSEDRRIIYHKHNNVPELPVLIQEIDSNSDNDKNDEGSVLIEPANNLSGNRPSCDLIVQDNFADFEGINSEEEFDVVNIDEFTPYASLLRSLKGVAAAQKAMSTGIMDEEDEEAINGMVINSNQSSTKSKNTLEYPDNNNSSASPNLEAANKMLTYAKDDISENAQIVDSQGDEFPLDDCDNAPKTSNTTGAKDGSKLGMSRRMKKVKSALQNRQNNLKSKDTGEGSVAVAAEEEIQKPQQQQQEPVVDAKKNESLRTGGLFVQRHQILSEIMKHNLHLKCKPFISKLDAIRL